MTNGLGWHQREVLIQERVLIIPLAGITPLPLITDLILGGLKQGRSHDQMTLPKHQQIQPQIPPPPTTRIREM